MYKFFCKLLLYAHWSENTRAPFIVVVFCNAVPGDLSAHFPSQTLVFGAW